MAGLAIGLLGSLLGPVIAKPLGKILTGRGRRRRRFKKGQIKFPPVVNIGGRRRKLKQRRLRRL